jgi:beta-fructofuranosidase
MFSRDDKWIWDFWFARDGGRHHMFFLQADKALGNPDLRHWHVTIGHAVSSDLKNWEYLGPCFAPSPAPAWDDCTTWTGSVVKGDNGLWHLFYTGTSRAEDGLKQRIGHATSRDLHHWERVSGLPLLDIDPAVYEEYKPGRWHDRAFRDPWVIRDPAGAGWLMFFTARNTLNDADPNAAGAIGLARSGDLFHWQLHPPVYAGGDFGQLEVPQVLVLGGQWYCLFCTTGGFWSQKYAAGYKANHGADPVGGTHYLRAASPLGPWTVAEGVFLDGDARCARYSGKVVETAGGPVFMAFENVAADGGFIGRISDPVPVYADEKGGLHLQPPTTTGAAL